MRYRNSSRELRRISTVALSPLYNHINESLQGLATIRAFRAVSRLMLIIENYFITTKYNQLLNFEFMIFMKCLDLNEKMKTNLKTI